MRSWWARSTSRRPSSAPYLEHLDLAFSFEFLLHRARRGGAGPRDRSGAPGWGARRGSSPTTTSPGSSAGSGPPTRRLTAVLLLTLPGPAFIYQGDEIGMTDGPGTDPPVDRLGRDSFRHPMQWEAGAGGRLHRRRAVAAADRPERAERGGPGRSRRLDARALPRADRLAPAAGSRASRTSGAATGSCASAAASISSRSTSPIGRPDSRPRGELVLATDPGHREGGPRGGRGSDLRGAWFEASCLWILAGLERMIEPEREARRRDWHCCCWVPSALSGCTGSDSAEGSGTELSFFIFNEPSGAYQEAADEVLGGVERRVHDHVRVPPGPGRRPARAARPPARRRGRLDRHHRHGRDLDGRVRQRRLHRAVGGRRRAGGHRGRLRQRGRVGVASRTSSTPRPFTSNTQLLWYRKDRVDEAAQDLGRDDRRGRGDRPEDGLIQVQANRYEGFTVWVTAMIESAGRADPRRAHARSASSRPRPSGRSR